MDEGNLREFFRKAGEIKRVVKWVDKDFAFVGFENHREAYKAMNMDMSKLGENVRVEMDDQKNNQVDKRNLKAKKTIDKGQL